jgi:oligoendopeptidase F
MKFTLTLLLFVALVPFSSFAQTSNEETQTNQDLRAQLADVQAKEAELQARARQLDEELKPENIQRSLAGVGSTRPEELREHRRRQLSIEKEGILRQLKLVATSRERLESAINLADTRAYQKSAEGSIPPSTQMLKAQSLPSPRLLVGVAVVLAVFAGVFVVRRIFG